MQLKKKLIVNLIMKIMWCCFIRFLVILEAIKVLCFIQNNIWLDLGTTMQVKKNENRKQKYNFYIVSLFS